MAERMVTLERNTNETQIELTLDLDGTGRYEIDTGCGFLNHMLELFARHGRFDLVLTCHGDVQVDYHHTTEDVGIALGQAFARALGDMRGIQRYGSFYLPVILLQDRQQQVAGIGFFAAKVPGKLHRTAQQLIRLVRKAFVPAKAKFFPNTHLPAPC